MKTCTRTIVFALFVTGVGLAMHPSQTLAMGMDDDGTDLDDGYYQHGEWHPPEDDDQDRRRFLRHKRTEDAESRSTD